MPGVLNGFNSLRLRINTPSKAFMQLKPFKAFVYTGEAFLQMSLALGFPESVSNGFNDLGFW